MDISSIYPDDSGNVFDSMVEGMDSIFVIKTKNVHKLADQLAVYHSLTGRVAYHWHDNSGIKRFDLQHITIPKTQRLIDAIYHIGNTQHFGIFLFSGFTDQLQSPMIANVVKHFLESTKQQRKYIIFADPHPLIPKDMAEHIQELTIESTDSAKQPEIRTSYLYS